MSVSNQESDHSAACQALPSSPTTKTTDGMPGAAVTAMPGAGAPPKKLNPSFGKFALSFELCRACAEALGREFPPAIRIVDRALAEAGIARSERKRLIAALKADASPPETN